MAIEFTPQAIKALDASSLGDMFVSYKKINVPEVTIPVYDDNAVPEAIINKGNLTKAVDNIKAKFSESPVFKFKYTIDTEALKTPLEATSNSITSSSTADFIKNLEGFRNSRYKDAGGTSIGYGFYGDRYFKGNHITREEADKVLDNIIQEQETYFSKYPIWNLLTPNLKTAIHSYAYNVGYHNKKLSEALNSGDLAKIRNSMSIVTSQGKRNEVLVKRRNEEKKLFDS